MDEFYTIKGETFVHQKIPERLKRHFQPRRTCSHYRPGRNGSQGPLRVNWLIRKYTKRKVIKKPGKDVKTNNSFFIYMKNVPWLQQDKEKKIDTIMTYLFKIKYSPQVSFSVSEYDFAEKFEIPSIADII